MTDKQIIINCIHNEEMGKPNAENALCLIDIDDKCCKDVEIRYCYYKQLKAKEQECEELKNFHINLVGVKECEIKELLKLKQTLAEIKEIAEFGFRPYKVCGEHNNCCDVLNEILQKISKCEVGDKIKTVDLGFWDKDGKYIEDIQTINITKE